MCYGDSIMDVSIETVGGYLPTYYAQLGKETWMRLETTTPKRNGLPALLLYAASAFLLSPASTFAQMSPGWNPVPRPGSPAQLYEDFDLTGLQEIYTELDFGFPDPVTTSITDFGGLPYGGFFDFGGDTGIQSVTDKISGVSKYQWQWTAPNNPKNSMPDKTDFPPPPFFAVGEVHSQVNITPYDPNKLVGLKSTTVIGLEGGSKAAVQSKTINGTVLLEDQQIVTGIAKDDMSSVTFAPYISLTASGTQAGGSARTDLQMIQNVSPLLLGNPDPFKSPDVFGDGGNQYVYNDNGYLAVPADVHLAVSYLNVGKWLPSYIDWKTDIPVGNPENTTLLPYTRVNALGAVVPSVTVNGVTQAGYLYFGGLPLNNADFGNHKVTMLVKTNDPPFQPTGKGAKVPAPPAVLPPGNLEAAQNNGRAANQNGGLANVAPPPQKTK